MHAKIKIFYTAIKTAVISLQYKNLTQEQYQNIQLELVHHHITFHPREWSQQVLLSADLMIPSPGQGFWRWYELAEVNNAFTGMKEFGWKVCM